MVHSSLKSLGPLENGAETKFVYSKKETDAVVTTCTGVLHEKRKLDFMVVVATANHIKSPSEVPGFIITVPAPGSIGVGIMSGTVVMIRAARRVLARDLSFAIGVRVNCNSSTVSGQGVGTAAGDEPLVNRWKNSRKIKDILKDALGIVRKLLTGNDLIHRFPRGVFCRFLFDQFLIKRIKERKI